ncbi:MAG: DegV family protein [Clostridia bacterium]|nr:DegV family protein [Clostridia bacterium]
MSNILLVAESGSDLTPELAREYGITVVPMHVSFGGTTRDDGAFPVTEMFDHYKRTRDLPRTSGCTPHDFEEAFDRLQREHPGKEILYLAYSACTTCSMQSALIAAEGRKGMTAIDTKSVSAAQSAIVLAIAKLLADKPETTMDEAVRAANDLIARVRMGFFPGDLDYLRAGGRVSNAAYLGAKILGLHPLIEIEDGKLISTKKYRGTMARVVKRLAQEYPDANALDRSQLWLIYSEGLDGTLRREAEKIAREQGFEQIGWVKTGCVIAAHSGPGAFGIVGFAKG